MGLIYDAAAKFIILKQCEYHFVVSKKRKLQTIKLNFKTTDFFHLAGLHYLTDIVIPQRREKTIDEILINHTITDEIISKSQHYINTDSKKDVKSRIEELRFLEEYLDTDNFIRIFNVRNQKNMSSVIVADYMIESWFKGNDTVYIFIRQRNEEPEYYCVVSFFKKGEVTYSGDNVYWMEKVKKFGDVEQTLYINPSYKK